MIRQAHSYLAGAVSGAVLIAIAVIAFVMLVSLQATRDWPFAGLVQGGDDASPVSAKHPAAGSGAAGSGAAGAAGGAAASSKGQASGGGSSSGVSGGEATFVGPVSTVADDAGGGSKGGGGSAADSPTTSAPASNGGGGSGSSGGGSSGTNGGNGGGSSPPAESIVKGASEAVTNTVNETVAGVGEAAGGAVAGTGVTKSVEGAVDGLTGSQSVVGQALHEVGGTVTGSLGGS